MKSPMAKKKLLKPKPLEDPPTPASESDDNKVDSSSGEDEEESQSQISSSSAEEDEPKTPSTPLAKSAAAASSSESGSESEPEPEPEPEPEEITTITKKKESDGSTAVKSGKKRASEATTSKGHAKRAKKVSGDDEKKHGEDNKKPLFQRLWTEEDEISLLQGMINFEAEEGKSPYVEMNGFFDVTKENISFDVSKVQFTDKIRSLKRKYMGKDNKGKKSSSFSKPHDLKCLTLAKCIWGPDGMALDSAVKPNVVSNKVDKKKKKKLEPEVKDEDKQVLGSDEMVLEGEKVEEDKQGVILGGNLFEKSFLLRCLVVSLGADEYSVKQKWSKVPMETKKRIEEKLKLMEDKEWGLVLEKTDIVKEVATVINEAS